MVRRAAQLPMNEETAARTNGTGILVRYARQGEEVKIRVHARQGRIALGTLHTSQYKLGPACLNDVGVYYCAREDASCLSGFGGRGQLAAHLRPVGACMRCALFPPDDWDGVPLAWHSPAHTFRPRVDPNPKPHVLAWICKYHGPETMRPQDVDEQISLDIRAIVSNQQWDEYMRGIVQRQHER